VTPEVAVLPLRSVASAQLYWRRCGRSLQAVAISRAPRAVKRVPERIRILRVIARMNVGGPAHHVSILSGRLDPARYETLLVCGRVGPGEAPADDLAARHGARLVTLDSLTPELNPLNDLRATVALARMMRRFRPHIVHSHTAKAGFIARLAAVISLRPRPRIVHTYHGHVLEANFGRAKSTTFRLLERAAARVSDVLIGVSQVTVDDLVRLRVASAERFRVIPLGLDLEPFRDLPSLPDPRLPVRVAAGAGPDDVLFVWVARVTAIKRADVALEAVALARRAGAPVRLAVVGDGTLRPALEEQARSLGIDDSVVFLGFRRDIPAVVAAADAALLTSDMEGTPVALIEAGAGARPAVSTSVGGVREVVADGGGFLAAAGDARGIAAGILKIAEDRDLRVRMGRVQREHVLARYRADRLLEDIDALYSSLLFDGSKAGG
jgi:glycosyltransferase involved in cell wall biosynthesis